MVLDVVGFPAPEAVSGAGGGIDGAVGGLGAGVGDACSQEPWDLGPPRLDGTGKPLELG